MFIYYVLTNLVEFGGGVENSIKYHGTIAERNNRDSYDLTYNVDVKHLATDGPGHSLKNAKKNFKSYATVSFTLQRTIFIP